MTYMNHTESLLDPPLDTRCFILAPLVLPAKPGALERARRRTPGALFTNETSTVGGLDIISETQLEAPDGQELTCGSYTPVANTQVHVFRDYPYSRVATVAAIRNLDGSETPPLKSHTDALFLPGHILWIHNLLVFEGEDAPNVPLGITDATSDSAVLLAVRSGSSLLWLHSSCRDRDVVIGQVLRGLALATSAWIVTAQAEDYLTRMPPGSTKKLRRFLREGSEFIDHCATVKVAARNLDGVARVAYNSALEEWNVSSALDHSLLQLDKATQTLTVRLEASRQELISILAILGTTIGAITLFEFATGPEIEALNAVRVVLASILVLIGGGLGIVFVRQRKLSRE